MTLIMARFASADPEWLPWLDFVAMGGQSHLFGTASWVVKIPRWSWPTALGRVLVHPATPVRALEVLGGLLEPLVVFEQTAFRGPRVADGRPVPSTDRAWRARWAMAGARHAAEDFLDRRIALATPGEAAALISALLDTLEAIRARGWHVLDFIMSNFVVGADSRVRLVDAGLLIPASHLRGPSQQISSRFFVRCLGPDYRGVLAAVAARHGEDEAGRERLQRVVDCLGPRLDAWRAGRVTVASDWARPSKAALAPALREQIFAVLEPVRHKMPLTTRRPSGYTASHHAIPSEN